MRQSKLQFDTIRVVNTQPLAQTLNLIQIYIDQHATSVCFRWVEHVGPSKLIQTNSVESNLELTYYELNSVSLVCLMKFSIRPGSKTTNYWPICLVMWQIKSKVSNTAPDLIADEKPHSAQHLSRGSLMLLTGVATVALGAFLMHRVWHNT